MSERGCCMQIQLGEKFVPIVLPLVHEETDVLFDLLVNALGLPVSLQMIGSRGG
jgi:hypothetical protein